MTIVLSVTAHNGRLPFPISSPACNRAAATSVDRISSFPRSGSPPDFHISPRSRSVHHLRVLFLYPSLSLSRFRRLQQLRGITEKPRETKITDAPPACGGRDRRKIASSVGRMMSGTATRGEGGEIDREGEDVGYVVRRLERERTVPRGLIRSRFTVSSCKFYDGGIRRSPSVVLRTRRRCPSPPFPPPRALTHARTQACTHAFVMRVISGARQRRGWQEGRRRESVTRRTNERSVENNESLIGETLA